MRAFNESLVDSFSRILLVACLPVLAVVGRGSSTSGSGTGGQIGGGTGGQGSGGKAAGTGGNATGAGGTGAGGRGTGAGGAGAGGQGGRPALTLTSTMLANGGTFLPAHTCAGDSHSPPLASRATSSPRGP
jgi:hypothetical protein